MNSPILAPAAALALWSLIMLFWVMATRIKAFSNAGIELGSAPAGGRYQDLEPQLPASTNWKSHNFVHLMEQPTVFYATVMVLALAGQGEGLNLNLAWAYVLLRVAHSFWQALVNTIPVRFALYLLSTLCLLVMAINAVRATVF